jgi:hypothetical protein
MRVRSQATLIYNVTGQELEMLPPYAELITSGAPTAAASYDVFGGTQSNDQTPRLTGTATLDSVSLTLSAASGYSQSATNRAKLNLNSTTGLVVGREYVLANALGQREIVAIREIGTGYALSEQDLAYDYAIGDTLMGIRQSFVIGASFIQDVSNINIFGVTARLRPAGHNIRSEAEMAPPYRVRWTYAVGGLTRILWTYFDVARQQAKSGLSIHDLRQHFPDIGNEEWQGQRGTGFVPQIEAGWDKLMFDVRASGYDVDAIREGPMLTQLHLRATLAVIAEAGITPPGRDPNQWAMEKRMDYQRMFERAIGAALNVWIDQGTDGSITPQPVRRLRLRR